MKVGYPADGFSPVGLHPAHGAIPEWSEGLEGYSKRYASRFGMSLIGTTSRYGIQLDLFLDYAHNVKLYPAFQEYFRKSKPPLLAIWGKNDPFFLPAGAEAYRRDIPSAEVQLLDTGHFATETHVVEIAAAMQKFLGAHAG